MQTISKPDIGQRNSWHQEQTPVPGCLGLRDLSGRRLDSGLLLCTLSGLLVERQLEDLQDLLVCNLLVGLRFVLGHIKLGRCCKDGQAVLG